MTRYIAERHIYGVTEGVAWRAEKVMRYRALPAGWIVERAADAPDDDARRRCYYRLTPAGSRAASAMARRLADLVYTAADRGLVVLDGRSPAQP